MRHFKGGKLGERNVCETAYHIRIIYSFIDSINILYKYQSTEAELFCNLKFVYYRK